MSAQEGRDHQMFLFVAAIILIFLVAPAVYAMYAGEINAPLLKIAQAQLFPFRGFAEVKDAGAKLAEIDPASLDWEMMAKILAYAGSWFRWIALPFLAFMLLCSVKYLGRVEHLTRKFDMESLLQNNAHNFPCLRPIVGKGKYLLSQESFDSGLWKIARTPLQFALENGLLTYVNGQNCPLGDALRNGIPSRDMSAFGQCKFDDERALEVMQRQLGAKFHGINELQPERKALATAFMLYTLGRKKDCLAILDAISSSYLEKDGKCAIEVLGNSHFLKEIDEAISKDWHGFKQRMALTIHEAFELPFFMALLIEARKKGVLASSQFLWLRPMDRPLWYALNQCGGRAAWTEGLAAWTHYYAEEQAKAALEKPQVSAAVSSLKQSLAAQGWLMEMFTPPPTQASQGFEQEISLETVCAPAEEEPGD